MAEYKDKLIKEYTDRPLYIGEQVYVKAKHFDKPTRNIDKNILCKIVGILDDNTYQVECIDKEFTYGFSNKERFNVILHTDEIYKNLRDVGYNPFQNIDFYKKLEHINYDMESILLTLNIDDTKSEMFKFEINNHIVPEYTDNPFIIDRDGNKVYYQRDYVWSLEDEQLFIESIYNNLDCGKIVVRKRGYEYVEDNFKKGNFESVAFNDIVDGKQRLNTLKRFVNDEFMDMHGKYYSDLSATAHMYFKRNTSITFIRMGEDTTDEDVIKTFLMINFSGKPCSKEHLDFVKTINI